MFLYKLANMCEKRYDNHYDSVALKFFQILTGFQVSDWVDDLILCDRTSLRSGEYHGRVFVW